MILVRRLARPLLAAPFIARGVEAVRRPGTQVESTERLTGAVSSLTGDLEVDAELLVRITGAVQVGAGALLALGRAPRVAALALTVSSLPQAFGTPFWTIADPEERAVAQQEFLETLGLVGGALLAAVDTAGRPGLAYRAGNAARIAGLETRLAARDAASSVQAAAHKVSG